MTFPSLLDAHRPPCIYSIHWNTTKHKHGDYLQTVLCGNLIIDPITNIWDGVNICVLPWIGAESSWRVGVLSQAAQTNGDLTPEQIIAAIGVYCPHAHCAMKCLFMTICLMCLVAHGCRSLLGSSLANQWLLLVWSCSRSSFPYVHMYGCRSPLGSSLASSGCSSWSCSRSTFWNVHMYALLLF